MGKRVEAVVLRMMFSGMGSVRARAKGKGHVMSIESSMLANTTLIHLSVNRKLVERSSSFWGEAPMNSMTPSSSCGRSFSFRTKVDDAKYPGDWRPKRSV